MFKNIIQAMCVLGCWGCMIAAGMVYDHKAVGIVALAMILVAVIMELLHRDEINQESEGGAQDGGCEVDQDND